MRPKHYALKSAVPLGANVFNYLRDPRLCVVPIFEVKSALRSKRERERGLNRCRNNVFFVQALSRHQRSGSSAAR